MSGSMSKAGTGHRRGRGLFLWLCAGAGCAWLAFGAWGRSLDLRHIGAMVGRLSIAVNREQIEENIQGKLQELLLKNEEAREFAEGYEERALWLERPVDLAEDIVPGEVPLLMQWDKRWGYNSYGDSIVGLAGCGPVCLSMAYLYLTGETDMDPRAMSEFAYDSGYYTQSGTSWRLWTEGAEKLGLDGRELMLDENAIRSALDDGNLVVCSMGPGDFTSTGHFVLIRGYDEDGFYVNDPNKRSNSEAAWSYEVLSRQIKNLWGIGVK